MSLKNFDFSQTPKLLINGNEYEFDQKINLTDHVFNNAGSKLKIKNVYKKNSSTEDLFEKINYFSDYSFAQLFFGDKIFYSGFIKSQSNNSLVSFMTKKADLEIVSLKELLVHQPMDFAIYQKSPEWVIDQIIDRLNLNLVKKGKLFFDTNENIISYNTKDMSAFDTLKFIENQTNSRMIIENQDGAIIINFYSNVAIQDEENENIGTPIIYDSKENINNFNTINQVVDINWSNNNSNNYNAVRVESEKTISNISRRLEISLAVSDEDFTLEFPVGKIDFKKIYIYNNNLQIRKLIVVRNDLAEKGYNFDISYAEFSNTINIHPRLKQKYPNGKIVFYYFPLLRQDIDFENNQNQINLASNFNANKFKIFRYEKYNDLTNLNELIRQGKSLLDIGQSPKLQLEIVSKKPIWNLGESVKFLGGQQFPQFSANYVVKSVEINLTLDDKLIDGFFKYLLSDIKNLDSSLNYFDPQFYRDNPLLNNDLVKIEISKSINIDFNLITTDFLIECVAPDESIPNWVLEEQ